MYVRGMDGIVLAEGEELDIYVKYTLDKDTADVKVSSSYTVLLSRFYIHIKNNDFHNFHNSFRCLLFNIF